MFAAVEANMMTGVITLRHVILHPLLVVDLVGWRGLLRALTWRGTFLALVVACHR
jgi:hypothetical protein